MADGLKHVVVGIGSADACDADGDDVVDFSGGEGAAYASDLAFVVVAVEDPVALGARYASPTPGAHRLGKGSAA